MGRIGREMKGKRGKGRKGDGWIGYLREDVSRRGEKGKRKVGIFM